MALATQPYKGARDFYPEDKLIQNYIFSVMRDVAKSYGYQEYDAPILEPLELYKAKSGDEIVNDQTYNFTDRGGREVAIRPEMTPTVSRMVAAKRQELPYPLRWFSIPNLWRYERPQRGRLREHWQLNVDIFGEESLAADHEIISVAANLLKTFGAKPSMYEIKINSRVLVNQLMSAYFGLNDDQAQKLIRLIDKFHKTDNEKFEASLTEINADHEKVKSLLNCKSLSDLPEEVKDHKSVQKIGSLLTLLEEGNITNAVFDVSLMRGFDYYTDIVFEVFDTDPENNRSMFGGGRYDGLVGLFGVEPVATAGFGMGDVTLLNFLKAHNLLPALTNETDVQMVLISDVYPQAIRLAAKLREMELNVSVDATDRKIEKKLKSADKQGIRYVLFVGEEEISSQQYPLKDLVTGKEEKHSLERIATIIEDYRS